MKKISWKKTGIILGSFCLLLVVFVSCSHIRRKEALYGQEEERAKQRTEEKREEKTQEAKTEDKEVKNKEVKEKKVKDKAVTIAEEKKQAIVKEAVLTATPEAEPIKRRVLTWNPQWQYAEFSQIHTGNVTLYQVSETTKTVAVNAGHGTEGGSVVQTLCHPDGSPKVTGGSTASGAVYATAVSGGATMLDGTAEAEVNLKLAELLKEKLLDHGFNVCMIRADADVQLDNIARTVFANENADCHIALHFDSTENDKGFFYIGVPEVASYKNMEPVASCWRKHQELGEQILEGMEESGRKIFGSGRLDLDLTQTSYSKIPSVDLEVGDRGSDHSDENLNQIADGIVAGIQKYFNGIV